MPKAPLFLKGRLGHLQGHLQDQGFLLSISTPKQIVWVYDNNMDKIRSTWGGPGRGGGKKPQVPGASAVVPMTVKLTEAQKAKLQRLGGAPWVREKIDQAEEPKPKE